MVSLQPVSSLSDSAVFLAIKHHPLELIIATKIIALIAVVYGCLALGYVFGKRINRDTNALSRDMMRWLLLAGEPIVIVHAFWQLDLGQGRILLLLPGIGFCVSFTAMWVAFAVGKMFQLPRRSQGAMMTCALHSNTGITLGSFICYLLLGAEGLAYGILYCVYIMPTFASVGLVSAKTYGQSESQRWKETLAGLAKDPLTIVPNTAILLGLVCNFAEWTFHSLLDQLVEPWIFLLVGLYSLAVGMTLRFSQIRRYIRECWAMAGIKFVWSPTVGWVLASVLSVGAFDHGLPLKVIVIQAAMPVGLIGLTLTRLFDLDSELSNSVWITSTLAIIPLLPLLQLIVGV